MSTAQKKSALLRLGYFGETSYISIGEPYDSKRPERKNDDDAPAPFKLGARNVKSRYGSIQSGLFDPHGGAGVGVGCNYTTLAQETLKENAKKKLNQVFCIDLYTLLIPFLVRFLKGELKSEEYVRVIFQYNSGKPKSEPFPNGARIPYVEQGPKTPLQKDQVPSEPPNIRTNPIKKGSYGTTLKYIGVPFSGAERRSWLAQSAYLYAADPYDSARLAAKAEKAKMPKNISEEPFRCASFTAKGGPGRWGGSKAGGLRKFGGQIGAFPAYIEAPDVAVCLKS